MPLKHGLKKVQQCSKLEYGVLYCVYHLNCIWSKLLVVETSPDLINSGSGFDTNSTLAVTSKSRLCANTGGALWTAFSTRTAFSCHCQEEVNRSGVCCALQVGQGSFILSVIRLPRVSIICGLTFFSR